ncbi:hypothetical protein N7468_008352 [Penicillium chermesinum]|uniref:Uncharacterized protein n=1 Tax=Penicillium chermesinum TaxID=63820 RepID=A0A9W9NPJ7_9EURO|nr:uncharacterized protein N7468_008352 [Penicillium chermesinum]KAJ5223810.1 hypothetical protein N7468_008352 [Penicillium chermesinum]KAJ6155365.1 hypothetical protein N7470_005931 [Penicillium chermesinum]
MGGSVVITGANGSLALGFVEAFLKSYPQYTLIAAVRNTSTKEDANTAKLASLIARYPKAKAHIESIDLGSLVSTRSFADNIAARIASKELPPIVAIICNAFTWSLESGQKFTVDDMEATFQVGHLSHYLLVLKLLGSMDVKSGRVVLLGSIVHFDLPNPISSLVAGFPEDFDKLVTPDADPSDLIHDRGFQRYANAKLANITFLYDLNKRLEKDPKLSNITVTAMDPGGLPDSRSQAGQKRAVRGFFALINVLMPALKYFTSQFRTTRDAGRDLATLSLDPSFKGKRGYYIGTREGTPSKVAMAEEVQKKLWDGCWKWANLTPEETVLQNSASNP